jgi:hypothetical protein
MTTPLITNYFKNNNKSNYNRFKTDYYEYLPRKISEYKYDDIFNEVKDLLTQSSSRYSCVLSNRETNEYTHLNTYFWTPIIEKIKDNIESEFNILIDYGLVHLYKDGNSNIAWHSDKEAYDSFVISISFGATRKFSLKEIENEKNKIDFDLYHGDMFIMKNGCQEKYQHAILKASNINIPRISITFRERKK